MMLHSLHAQFQTLLAPALAQRLTLLFNHMLTAEPVARQRLAPHATRRVQVVLEGWPALLPQPPALQWLITPPGLLEWCAVGAAAEPDATPAPNQAFDLTLRVDASNPAALFTRGLTGTLPQVQIDGDAQLAAEVNWLMQNLRWDVAADVERFVGPGPAQALHQGGAVLKEGLRAALATAGQVGERLRAWRA